MKLKRTLIIVISIMIFCILLCYQSAVYAEGTMYLGITELMSNNEVDLGTGAKSYFGYGIGNPYDSDTTVKGAKIWNIVQYASETDDTPIDAQHASIYCVKAGVGFSDSKKRQEYDIFYDMKKEREQIKRQNETLKSIVEGEITLEDGTKINKYNAILAILDNFYIIGKSAPEEKDALLQAAGIDSEAWDLQLNEDDVKAVQQSALWYFTNYGDSLYDKTEKTSWLNYTTDGRNYTSLSDFRLHDTDEGIQRQAQAEILYKYLIKKAKENAKNYDTTTTSNTPAKVNTTTLNYETIGENYIVGPINITENSNNIPYTIKFMVKEEETDFSSYSLLDENKIPTEKSIKQLVGKDFYISIPKSSITIANLNIGIDISYSNTELTLCASSKNNSAQPVVIPSKKLETIPFKLATISRKFDLALRKYITKVNDVELTEATSRVPKIEEESLEDGTTAIYKHKKDPVTVKTGDKVTYKITIYNEGEKAGRATEIIDQLPTGLKFKNIVSGNFKLGTYNESRDNALILIRKDGDTKNLDAYTKGSLSSETSTSQETIEIECEVKAIADSKNHKILTNVAWISKEVDGETNVEITDQKRADRDSEPSTRPDVNKDNMSDYLGKDNKDTLNDSNYFYKGQQDDDDFEKLVLMPETFDLKLVKRIVAVNGTKIPERIESVDVSKLNVIDGNTTANYKLNKEPIAVKKGDIITYTFRIYNEGTIDGYASEITEDIPDGLQFLWSEKEGTDLKADKSFTDEEKSAIEFNQKFLWGKFIYDDKKENIIQISTNYLDMYRGEPAPAEGEDMRVPVTENIIKAFGRNDGTKTEADLSYKEISVKLKVVSDNITGTVIRNEAEISEDTDENGNPVDDRDSDTEEWVKYEDDEDYDNLILQSFDLALRKFIVAVSKDETIESSEYLKNSDGSYKRAPKVDTSKLNTEDEYGRLITTAIYNHTKEPVEVSKNDIVVYMVRVYNEGDIDGYASEIKDHLPPYLEFVKSDFNDKYDWKVSEDGKTVTTKYLGDTKNKINKIAKNEDGKIVLSYKEVPIMCKVKGTAKVNQKITNIADITEYRDGDKKIITDRDSQINNVELPDDEKLPSYKDEEKGEYIAGQQDDDDFEKVIIHERPVETEKVFDLSLRKFIIAISDDETIDDSEYLKEPDGTYKREPKVDTSKLNTKDEKGNTITTAIYKHTKEPVKVNKNNIVIYMLRIYNEGSIDGYASEIKDYLPTNLEYVNSEFNNKYGWKATEDGRIVTTRYLEESIINKAESDEDGKITLSYKEVPIMCKVKDTSKVNEKITNLAEISEYKDGDKKDIKDRDSQSNNINLPKDEELPSYKDDEKGEYIAGQQDDDDFEKVIIPETPIIPEELFDLSLRKFIIAVSSDETIDDKDYLKDESGLYKREPVVDTTKLNTKDEKGDFITTATYNHTKEPVLVKRNDIVVYMLRVYNEGQIDGYASEIKDHLPFYLEFVDGDFNKKYGWNLSEDGRTVTTRYLEDKIITKATKNAEGKIVLDYNEVPIMCKVKGDITESTKITNIADITEYKDENNKDVKDRDSQINNVVLPEDKDLPTYKDNEKGSYISGQQDDDDFEKLVIKTFDLALRKWVTQAIVIEDGKQNVKNTGHQPFDDPEQVVKVELHRKKLDKVTVKFRYSIRVINEGDVEGYAKEIKDYIPKGLKFIEADNPGWKDEGNNVITTKLLEDRLLKPGEYADIEVLLTWTNGENNIGLKVNTAEISKDYNKFGLPDKDSTPDNKKQGEDDIDDAPVMLSIGTGQIRIFFTMSFILLITVGGGIMLIKRYAL